MPDLFSGHADVYAAFRPTYPEALYAFLLRHVTDRCTAWDCATGNGQVAKRLAQDFELVYATDISEQQMRHAEKFANIRYMRRSAEASGFPDSSIDLITVGQALHWFDLPVFFREAMRVAKPGALFAAWGYANVEVNPSVDDVIRYYYEHVVGKYWDERRSMIEDHYTSIAFPFPLLPHPPLAIEVRWTRAHLLGYIESWSATQGYKRDRGEDPVPGLGRQLSVLWPDDETMDVRFPLFVKAGVVKC